jgi:hypothetical protein
LKKLKIQSAKSDQLPVDSTTARQTAEGIRQQGGRPLKSSQDDRCA